MALYIPHSIFHLARLLYVRPVTFGPYHVYIYMGSRGTTTLVLKLGTREKWMDNYTTGPIYPQERPAVPAVQEAGWDRVGLQVLENKKKYFFPYLNSNPGTSNAYPSYYAGYATLAHYLYCVFFNVQFFTFMVQRPNSGQAAPLVRLLHHTRSR